MRHLNCEHGSIVTHCDLLWSIVIHCGLFWGTQGTAVDDGVGVGVGAQFATLPRFFV